MGVHRVPAADRPQRMALPWGGSPLALGCCERELGRPFRVARAVRGSGCPRHVSTATKADQTRCGSIS